VITSNYDDRVVPDTASNSPLVCRNLKGKLFSPIRIETSDGHGAGMALNKMIEKVADEWAFLADRLQFQR
jgi:prolyl oligopeptidase